METIIVQRPRTTIDLLLWRRHGRAGRGLIATTLALNPGLGALGAELPIGTSVTLPDLPAGGARQSSRRVLSLFGDA